MKTKLAILLWIVAGVLALFGVYAMTVINDPTAKEKAAARTEIENCWENQQRKSVGAAGGQLLAQACEQLENNFRERFDANP